MTGKRGIQIWVPVAAGYEFSQTQDWVEAISRAVGATVPDFRPSEFVAAQAAPMTVAAPIAAQASESIRVALAAELPPEAWSTVSDLVQRIDAALEDGDGRAVQRLSTELDSVRTYAGPPPSVPAPRRAAGGAPRRRLLALALLAVLLLGASGIALLGSGGDDGGGDEPDDGFAEPTTTTEEADETTTTFAEEATTTAFDPNEPAEDLGAVVVGADG